MFKKFDWSFKSIIKFLGVIFLGIFGVVMITALVVFSYHSLTGVLSGTAQSESDFGYGGSKMANPAAYDGFSVASGDVTSEMAPGIMPTPGPGMSTGLDAEDFEVKAYDGQIKTKNLEEVCSVIEKLKQESYVIFESANKNDFDCYYQFKVEKEHTDSILKIIQALKPENLNANITSIKKSIEGVDTELEILTKKLQSIEETLASAQTSYDEISKLATDQQDAETLAKIIDSKLNLIERLSTERLNIKSQIDYSNKNKADQLDQLKFTFFTISVNKDVIFDWKALKENWKGEAKLLVENISHAAQTMTLKLLAYFVYFALGVIYLFISVFLLKFVWKGVKRIWKSGSHN